MNCRVARRHLHAFLDQELGPKTRARVARHLEQCPSCLRRQRGERELELRLGSALARLDAGDRRAWERAVGSAVPAGARWSTAVGIGAIAACAVLAALLAFAFAPRDPGRAPRAQHPGPDRSAAAPPHQLSQEELEAMRPASVIGAAMLVAVASATSTSLLLQRHPEPRPEPAQVAPQGYATLESKLGELMRRQAALEQGLAELQMESRGGSDGGQRRLAGAEQDLEQMFARFLERKEAQAAAAAAPGEAGLAALLRELLDPALDDGRRADIWEQIRSSGQIDAAVAEFERRAAAAPFDAAARTELGQAYGQKMLTTGGGPEAGKWGARSSEAYLAALELDKTNWEARFSLAAHYYYADMRADSTEHFKVLLEQQQGRAPLAKHAQAYLWLGNIYVDQGQTEAAKEVWSQGLQLFPTDAALRARLQAFQ